ncbi:MAG TPA: cation transporter, partial [Thermodesulfobacteriota bacterium]|nr:cation transporter [Thermodesulfobacteriota bacterium]
MSETILNVEGMKCMHCKMAVEKALKEVPGVTEVKVD